MSNRNQETSAYCLNCSATLISHHKKCSVCDLDLQTGTGEIIHFSDAARQASDGLGGLIAILPVKGHIVRFIGKCTGGVFGIDISGKLVWREDWAYITSIDIEANILKINEIEVDIDKGSIESNS